MKYLLIVATLVCGLSLGACAESDAVTDANAQPDVTNGSPPTDAGQGGGQDGTTVGVPDAASGWDTTSTADSTVIPPLDGGGGGQTDSWTPPDVTVTPDAGGPADAGAPIVYDPSGDWMLVAYPSSQNICGYIQEFEPQTLMLTVSDQGVATATLEPPGWFMTLEFSGTYVEGQLEMMTEYVEEGPPSIGWATEHTHTIDVMLSSDAWFEGTYMHALVPNAAEPCTYYWSISGTKQ